MGGFGLLSVISSLQILLLLAGIRVVWVEESLLLAFLSFEAYIGPVLVEESLYLWHCFFQVDVTSEDLAVSSFAYSNTLLWMMSSV